MCSSQHDHSQNNIGWFASGKKKNISRGFLVMNIRDKNITSTRIAFPDNDTRNASKTMLSPSARRRVIIECSTESLCHGCEGFSDENSICNLASIQKPWARPFHVFTLIERDSINQHRKWSLEAPTGWIVKKVNEEFAQHELARLLQRRMEWRNGF